MNTHQSEYRHIYEEKVSADFPLEITIGVQGKSKIFQNSVDYFDWLQESWEAAYMWRGCVDVIAASNMMNMDIDIIIYEEGKVPEKKEYKPDTKCPWREDDPMKPRNWPERSQGKMTVLNYKNTHFNLIVGPKHMLTEYGSLTFQTAAQEELRAEAARRQVLEKTASGDHVHDSEGGIQDFAHTCNICKKGFTHKGNLFKHKKEHINSKTLEMPAKLRKEPSNHHNKFQFSGVKACDKCGAVFLSETLLTEHVKKYHVESSEIECDDYEPREKVSNKKQQVHCCLEENTDCIFQCETKDELKIHIEQKHRSKNQLHCSVCNIVFRDLQDLSSYITMIHKDTNEVIHQHKCRSCQ